MSAKQERNRVGCICVTGVSNQLFWIARRTPHIVWCARTMRLGSACWLRQPNISPPQGRGASEPNRKPTRHTAEEKAPNALPSGGAFFFECGGMKTGLRVCCRRAVSARSDCMWLRPLWGGCVECSYALFEGDLIEMSLAHFYF